MEEKHFVNAQTGKITDEPFSRINDKTIFNQENPLGNSLLHVAASSGNEEITQLIATHYPDLIRKTNKKGDTPLHVAARAGKLNTVKILFELQPSTGYDDSLLRVKNKKGNRALHEALLALQDSKNQTKDIESIVCLVRHLVSEDPEVSYFQNDAKKSPLCMAVELGNTDILEYILTALPEHSVHMLEGKSPVHIAIEQHNLVALDIITKHKGELLHVVDENKNTPLHCAANADSLKGVKRLLGFTGDDDAFKRNEQGFYPLHVACAKAHVGVVKVLLRKWPDPGEFLDSKGRNILHVAADNGNQDVVRFILKDLNIYGATCKLINEMDEDGNTPLHLAASHGHALVTGYLIRDKRSKSDLMNSKYITPYDIAEDQATKAQMSLENKESQKKDLRFDRRNSEVSKDVEKQSEKADSMKSSEPDLFGVMMTLSVLFVVHCCHIFVSRERSGLVTRCWRLISTLRMKRKPPKPEDIKDRINGLLVVAAIIVSAAFGASLQMPMAEGSKDNGPLQMFMFCDTAAMYVSLSAAIILCWAQLVDVNLGSLVVLAASMMVGFSLYMMCLSFLAAVYIGMNDYNRTFIIILMVLQAMCLALLLILSIPLIVPFAWKELAIRLTYFVIFAVYFGAYSLFTNPERSYTNMPDEHDGSSV